MKDIVGSINKFLTPEIITKTAKHLGEDEAKVQNSVKGVAFGILSMLSTKAGDKEIEGILHDASSSSLLSDVSSLVSGNESANELGATFLKNVFGNKLHAFTILISSGYGLTSEKVNKLTNFIAPLLAVFLGKKLTTGTSYSSLIQGIKAELPSIASFIPTGMSKLITPVQSVISSNVQTKACKTGSCKNYFYWLVIAAIILVLLLLRYCGVKTEETIVSPSAPVVEQPTPVVEKRILEEITLPSGVKLKAYPDGIEDKMLQFLIANKHKTLSADELKEQWFDFDAINFKFGSGTVLTDESYPQIDNINKILKEFPEANIKIGAYTDKVGSDDVNLKLSSDRATTLKTLLAKAGAEKQITGAEGYGSKFATVDASASEQERAKDRKISLRFTPVK